MGIKEVRRAVAILLAEGDVRVPTEHVAYVLLALGELHLLGDFDGEPEDYIERVRAAKREALKRVTEPAEGD